MNFRLSWMDLHHRKSAYRFRFPLQKGAIALSIFLFLFAAAVYGEGETDRSLDEIDASWMSQIPSGKKDQTKLANPDSSSTGEPSTPGGTDAKSDEASSDRARQVQEILEGNNNANVSPGPSLFSVVLRFAGLLIAMIVVFYFVVRFMKKKNGVVGPGNDLVQVIASVPLMPGKFLQIIDMAGQILVLGVSESGVQFITRVEDGNTSDRIRVWHSRNPGGDLPENLLGKLTDMIRGADFRFWPSEKSGSEQKIQKEPLSFSRIFDRELPRKEAGEWVEPPSSSGDQEQDLRNRLHRQKKKLMSMKESTLEEG